MKSSVRARRVPLLLAILALFVAGALVSAPASDAAVDTSRVAAPAVTGAAITGIGCAHATGTARSCFAELGPRHRGLTSMARPAGANYSDPLSASFNGFLPSDLKAAYNLPTSTSTATVAIVDAYDAPHLESDLAHYRSTLGLPPCTTTNGCFRKLNQNGTASPLPRTDPNATSADPGWAGETTLDVEAVSAVCPTCHIMVIESVDDDSSGALNMETAVKTAVAKGARYVSMSWGGNEFASETAFDAHFFSTKGVAYVASAGDSGYGMEYPAASPAVTAVGGTTLLLDGTTSRGWIEGAWNELSNNHGATGSGCSTFERKPGYQAVVSSAVCANRATSDVSMVADPYTGLSVYEAPYGWFPVGGTSLAAPMVAGLYAVAGTPAVGTTPASYPYVHAGAFNDVTLGSNGTCSQAALCAAGIGWDGPTGLGTPNGVSGFSAAGVTPVPDTLTLGSISGRSTYAGQRATVAVTARSSNGAPVTLSASGLPAGLTVSGTTITGAARKQGTFRVTVTATDTDGSRKTTAFVWKVRNHTIVATSRLAVSGALKVGGTVKAGYGSLRLDSKHGAAAHATVHIQWYANGKAIRKATKPSLKLTSALKGKHLTFTLTAIASHADKYSHSSARSGAVG